ncbi:MAG: RMD1 family protein, partial [Pseudolabrys sp.]
MSQLSSESSHQVTVRALLLGDRIDTAGLERRDVISTTPLAFRVEGGSYLVLFRYGVAVLLGMSPVQEDEIIRSLDGRIIRRLAQREEESAQIEVAPEKDEQITPNGTITIKALLPEHVLIIADAIATNLILAHDERNVS